MASWDYSHKFSLQEETSSQKLSVFHLNIRSLRNKIDEIETLVADKNFNILCFNEHWLSEIEVNVLNILDYQVASSFCRKNTNGGGSLILVKPALKWSFLDFINSLSPEKD